MLLVHHPLDHLFQGRQFQVFGGIGVVLIIEVGGVGFQRSARDVVPGGDPLRPGESSNLSKPAA